MAGQGEGDLDKLGYVPLPEHVAKAAGERYLSRTTGMRD